VMEILDAQVHLFADHSERHPWDAAVLADPSLQAMCIRYRERADRASADAMLALMDREGVRGALIVSPAIYGYDHSYSVDAWERRPDRFRVVGRADSARP